MENIEDWVTLKRFPNYRVGRDENGTIQVWSVFKRRLLYFHPNPVVGKERVSMRDDSGTDRILSRSILAFLLKHRIISWHEVDFRKFHVSPDGMLTPHPGHPGRQRRCFKSIDDALETCILLKQYAEGYKEPIFTFIHENRKSCISAVSFNCGIRLSRVEILWDNAVELFLKQIEEMNVLRIKPLFSWLCTCLKTTWIKERSVFSNEKGLKVAERNAAREELQYY